MLQSAAMAQPTRMMSSPEDAMPVDLPKTFVIKTPAP